VQDADRCGAHRANGRASACGRGCRAQRLCDARATPGRRARRGRPCPSAAPSGAPHPAAPHLKTPSARRLDAIGAIGIARCWTFGGRFGRPLYAEGADPRAALAPRPALTKEEYVARHAGAVKASVKGGSGGGAGGPASLDHFGEKLLTLKGRMKTAAGRRRAEARHAFMEAYLEQLCREIAGDA
jgi:HD superfamily phosphodiesterase